MFCTNCPRPAEYRYAPPGVLALYLCGWHTLGEFDNEYLEYVGAGTLVIPEIWSLEPPELVYDEATKDDPVDIRVIGTGFTSDSVLLWVVDGDNGGPVDVPATFVSETELTAQITWSGHMTAGQENTSPSEYTAQVMVSNPNAGMSSHAYTFSYRVGTGDVAPVITGINGGPFVSQSGDELVSISGGGFEETSDVFVDGVSQVAEGDLLFVSESELTFVLDTNAVTPAGATLPVIVTNSHGDSEVHDLVVEPAPIAEGIPK